ncbi:MAG: NAD(P)-dependent oxidoreductase [Acidobacteriota bacterium]|nr:NAD(P)-dependent oxidoreductase [Acidobacteriota bacterium]
MKRALVTGGSGFLGSFIADVLTEKGLEVTIFDRQPSPYLGSGQSMVVGDVRNSEALVSAAEGADAVFHFAALADLNEAHARARETTETNILGTVNALQAAQQVGASRFLFASTVYVYSRAGGFYRCSKQACEAYIEEFQVQAGLPFTILRYGSLYGPRSGESNGVYRLLKQAAQEGRVAAIGHPDDTREYLHVEDAARLSVEALEKDYENRRLVITGSHPTRLRDLFTMFSEILGQKLDIEYQEPETNHDTHYRVTPYTFTPRTGHKLTARHSVDMGQGVLQLLEELHGEAQTDTEDGTR